MDRDLMEKLRRAMRRGVDISGWEIVPSWIETTDHPHIHLDEMDVERFVVSVTIESHGDGKEGWELRALLLCSEEEGRRPFVDHVILEEESWWAGPSRRKYKYLVPADETAAIAVPLLERAGLLDEE